MGNVKLENGQIIPDRRTNGSRLRLDVGDWIKIFVTIGTIFIVIISGWTSLRITMEQLSVIVAQDVKDTAENKLISRDNRKDIEFIGKTIERIDKKLDTLINEK